MSCPHIKSGMRCKICDPPIEKKKPKPIRKVSVKNTIQLSNGERISRADFNTRIHEAKEKLTEFAELNELNFCWACLSNSKRLSWSHTISVAKCIADGKGEFAYDIDNMQNECTEKCHPETEARNFGHHYNKEAKLEIIKKYKSQQFYSESRI